ncbi:VOC family protein [Amycolatopsis echigonensis]|uniref:VOC family protein n=1 Tax=Amycolatopsis echigonensis TaxID=2576905 RepID=A0A8E1W0C8_9PSEU|nr:VOC family protein [Amycolatopsis echigonensis]MBB2501641.1 VOC family protein [Amycolatopsis echigonensis]
MLRLGITVLGVADVERATRFWSEALGLVEDPEWASETWRTLAHPGGAHALGLLRSESPAEPRPRLHLDLYTDTEDEQRAEVERLVRLGARRVDWEHYPPKPDFVVLADPDDNLFCVVDLSNAPSGS